MSRETGKDYSKYPNIVRIYRKIMSKEDENEKYHFLKLLEDLIEGSGEDDINEFITQYSDELFLRELSNANKEILYSPVRKWGDKKGGGISKSRKLRSARRASRRVARRAIRRSARRATRRTARRATRRASRRATRRSARRSTRRSARSATRRAARRAARRAVRRSTRRSVRRSAKRSAKRSTIKRYPKVKQGGKLPAIFVINLRRDKEKWKKYKDDTRYIRYSACNGIEMSRENPYFDRLQIMWNAGDRKKKCTAGILNSHMSVIEMIIQKKINKALVIEDDAIVDFTRLQKLNLDQLPQDSLIYFGGVLHPPTSFKDKSWSYEKAKNTLKPGLNVIQKDKYRVFGGFGYYIPRWEVAKEMYDIFVQKPKLKPLDTEMTYLQKKGIIKYLYYPALSYLHMDDAEKGVHGKSYIKRDMKHYG